VNSEHHPQHNMQKRILALILHLSALQLIVDVALCESFVCSFNITGNSTYPKPVSISEATFSCQAGTDSDPTAKLPVAVDAALLPFSTSFSGKHFVSYLMPSMLGYDAQADDALAQFDPG